MADVVVRAAAEFAASKVTSLGRRKDAVTAEYVAWLESKAEASTAVQALRAAAGISKSPARVLVAAEELYGVLDPLRTPEDELSATYAAVDEVQPRQVGIYFASPDFSVSIGAPTFVVSTATADPKPPYWKCDATTQAEIATTFLIPDWWTGVNIEADVYWWPLTGAGSGVPRLRCGIGSTALNGTSGATALGTNSDQYPALPATAFQLTKTTFGIYTPTAGAIGHLRLGRIGNSSGDTANTTEIGIVGVMVREVP